MCMTGHWPLRADVLSCSSVPSVSSAGYLDGQIIERTRYGVQPCFRHMQVSRSRLEIVMTEQQLNTATRPGVHRLKCI